MQENEKPYTTRLAAIIFAHFAINLVTLLFFILDSYSLIDQIVHSIIHAGFIYLIVQYLYKTVRLNTFIKIVWLLTILAFIFLNCIPFTLEMQSYGSIFSFYWEKLPQTTYGWPNAFLRFVIVFSEDFTDAHEELLIHFSLLVLNIYMLSLSLAIEYKLIDYFRKNLIENSKEENHINEEKA